MSYPASFVKGMTPDPYINIADWNNKHRYLPKESSVEPGKYRTSRTPYVEEILLELSPQSPTQEVVFIKPTQIGATEIGNCFLFCTAKRYPGPSMMAFPTDKMAMKHSKKKLAPSIAAMPILSDVIKPPKSRDSGNTLLLKEFPGGSWTFTGSNSPASARSDSIRYLIRDDYSGFLKDTGDEGFIGDLLRNRTDAFGSKRKIYTNGTPTLKDTCNMWPEWEESSQGHFFVPCPHCGHSQFMEFGSSDSLHGLKFTRDKTGFITAVWYVCKKCHGRIEEYQKTDMMAKGEYVHTYPERLKRGFKINGLYSPLGWFSWWNFATEFLSAVAKQKRGDNRAMRTWTNTRKADFYEEDGDQPDWTRLSVRGEPLKPLGCPEKGFLVVAGVDTHDDRLDVSVKAYGVGEESWLVYWGSIYGDPDLPGVWVQLDEILFRPWPHPSGVDLHIQAMGIDTGGHKTQAVYKYARERRGLVMAIKGSSNKNAPIISAPKKIDIDIGGRKIKNGVELWSIGVDQAKLMVYNRLRMIDPGPGFCHFPLDLEDEYFKQLTAEKLVKKFVKGYQVEEWTNTRPANHALDCEVYAMAAAMRLGVQTMDWVKLAKKFKVVPPSLEEVEKAAPPLVKPALIPKKKKAPRSAGGYSRPAWM